MSGNEMYLEEESSTGLYENKSVMDPDECNTWVSMRKLQ